MVPQVTLNISGGPVVVMLAIERGADAHAGQQVAFSKPLPSE
jgi:hypothetical protein